MLRTVGDQPTLREAILPEALRQLPEELARVDVLLDDAVFFARSCRSWTRGSVGRRHRWKPICG